MAGFSGPKYHDLSGSPETDPKLWVLGPCTLDPGSSTRSYGVCV